MKKSMRQLSFSVLFITIVVLAFASKGGGGDKKNNSPLKSNFTPIRNFNNFTLRNRPAYSGSYIFGQEKENNGVALNTIVTYQSGRITYVLPFKYKATNFSLNNPLKTNLQFIGVKIKMPK